MLNSLLVVAIVTIIAWLGSAVGMGAFFGIVLPYVAIVVFLAGVVWRMVWWAKSPVPFAIPTTGGQEKSLDFIKQAKFDCPDTTFGVVKRMFLEVFLFRSLFRNVNAEIKQDDPVNGGPRIIYYSSKWLWVFALLFHYCFFIVFFRHFRFFVDPVPGCVSFVEMIDGFLQIGAPRFFLTGGLLLVAILFLIGRRLVNPKVRYISLSQDYFPLFLLLGIVCTGILMRYFLKTDITQVKAFVMGLVSFQPISAEGIDPIFFVHVCLVSVLLIYFPFSKLTHMAGIFFSPTRNLPCNTRRVRHVNPWNPPKDFLTYPEYEDLYREAMAGAGLPLDKPLEDEAKQKSGD
ncbi:menaquinol oxidoreductase [Desulfovibrio sp. An276]|uniref:sulfate reduction electron transfer complex DsrMKJOP subunit DsrM n=1 Tax=Desulfovibrio sp. An276 TaxID=1965618 RepID=UPI000B3A022A|nr:sulfate reduction electron transfer complex DsrMKJOP subunit DsrM [Desulfovibrio sp. An276]OUO51029.1 menaquinol oxidoreductase [Desulfovibrio sp. An276]